MPTNTRRIARNTLMLYFRQILIMLVGLYAVRVVLETLGAEDYGIYNVAVGVRGGGTFAILPLYVMIDNADWTRRNPLTGISCLSVF
jgi:hypothetical protein